MKIHIDPQALNYVTQVEDSDYQIPQNPTEKMRKKRSYPSGKHQKWDHCSGQKISEFFPQISVRFLSESDGSW